MALSIRCWSIHVGQCGWGRASHLGEILGTSLSILILIPPGTEIKAGMLWILVIVFSICPAHTIQFFSERKLRKYLHFGSRIKPMVGVTEIAFALSWVILNWSGKIEDYLRFWWQSCRQWPSWARAWSSWVHCLGLKSLNFFKESFMVIELLDLNSRKRSSCEPSQVDLRNLT